MKNLFKKLFVGFTVLSLTACGSTTMQDNTFAAKENKDFTKYTNQLVVEYAENDYTTMHQFFEHPEDYVGKWLTVSYQKRYKDSKLPQFPVGKAIRDCDDKGNPLE